jgi:arylsulfatase A-like enzyme
VIITADHGGHERSHGTRMPEDMTVPMIFIGKSFERGKRLEGCSTLDIAPTVAHVMGLSAEREWEGKSIV